MRYALVTGSTKGIGLAVARALLADGWFVFLNYAHDDGAAEALRLDTVRHRVVKADLSTLAGVEVLARAVLAETDRLDCLVLNAGATCRAPLAEINPAQWQAVMDTNVNMPFFLIQRLEKAFPGPGNILFIGSVLSERPHSVSIPYGVSKAAANMLAQSLVKEFSPRGIRVNVICPGFIDTEWQKNKPEAIRRSVESKIALGHFGAPEDVAALCMQVVANPYINGAVLNIDGGYDMA